MSLAITGYLAYRVKWGDDDINKKIVMGGIIDDVLYCKWNGFVGQYATVKLDDGNGSVLIQVFNKYEKGDRIFVGFDCFEKHKKINVGHETIDDRHSTHKELNNADSDNSSQHSKTGHY